MIDEEQGNKLNITFIIGNGFDIGILKALDEKHTTTYKEFYDYLQFNLINKKNFIFEEIEKVKGTDLWLDFEKVLECIIQEKSEELSAESCKDDYKKIVRDWEEIQYCFADFMNEVVTPDIYKKVCNLDSTPTMEEFIGDLSEEQYECIKFPAGAQHHAKIDYNFLNFNYSYLLDNFVYSRFDPHPYSLSENNAEFNQNPKRYQKGSHHDGWWSNTNPSSVQRNVKVYHPHGTIGIPSSILFGNSKAESYHNSRAKHQDKLYYKTELNKRLDKEYWNKAEKDYSSMFSNTDLFVIYGHSLGETDKWWWKKMLSQIKLREKEIIIYEYGEQNLKEKLEQYCEKLDFEDVKDQIFCVRFDEETPLEYGFNFKKRGMR